MTTVEKRKLLEAIDTCVRCDLLTEIEADKIRSEIEIAHRNAAAADTLSRYGEASWWEHREQELWEELLKLEEDNG